MLQSSVLGFDLGSSESLKKAWYSTQVFQKALQASRLAMVNSKVSLHNTCINQFPSSKTAFRNIKTFKSQHLPNYWSRCQCNFWFSTWLSIGYTRTGTKSLATFQGTMRATAQNRALSKKQILPCTHPSPQTLSYPHFSARNIFMEL